MSEPPNDDSSRPHAASDSAQDSASDSARDRAHLSGARADAAAPEPPSPAPPPRLPRRLPTKIFGAIYALGALGAVVVGLGGLGEGRSWICLGGATVLFAASALAWEAVERSGDAPGALAWIGFPLAWLLGLAQVPLLALAVYPPLDAFLVTSPRLEARVVQEVAGDVVEIWFPEPVERENRRNVNLRFDDTPLPPDYPLEHPGDYVWTSERTLQLRLVPLRERLELGPVAEIVINGDPGLGYFHYVSGEPVPHQSIPVR